MRPLLSIATLLALAGCSSPSAPTAEAEGANADAKAGPCDLRAWYADADEDGRGDGLDVIFSTFCLVPNRTIIRGDCDDSNPEVHRGAREICDGIDNDCDSRVDGDDSPLFGDSSLTHYLDSDGDGYGDADEKVRDCSTPSGYVSDDTDCNDEDRTVNPGAADDTANGVDEDCDSSIDEAAPSTWTVSDLTEGDLVINEIMQNPSEVLDSSGEWFEVRNDSGADVDLDGLEVWDDPSGSSPNSFTVSGSLVVADGDYVLFGINDDTSSNGGISVDHDWGSSSDFTLGNGSDEIILIASGVTIDEVWWDGGATFPDPTAASMSLDPSVSNTTDNDDGSNWCEGETIINLVDLGTPGTDNDACPTVTYTWQDIYDDIFAIECTGCHTGGASSGGLNLDTASQIIDVPSSDVASMDLIEPGDTANSYLWNKLQDTQGDVGGSGQQMPKGSGTLDSSMLDMIETWILEGAPE